MEQVKLIAKGGTDIMCEKSVAFHSNLVKSALEDEGEDEVPLNEIEPVCL